MLDGEEQLMKHQIGHFQWPNVLQHPLAIPFKILRSNRNAFNRRDMSRCVQSSPLHPKECLCGVGRNNLSGYIRPVAANYHQ
ncbi:hypothetical protein BC938DRAFT_478381 [Jimgerdemannia flammicorona]|uniref:Uncharacterized protein n=1 Tax=Jimgerdemannia flammicorona TaxID=994334 RepID=A0A433QMZ8_9FUNG|nr:hypothetical protein BC938DRAFT_478381 [Jimgerdemannia flammicorona]